MYLETENAVFEDEKCSIFCRLEIQSREDYRKKKYLITDAWRQCCGLSLSIVNYLCAKLWPCLCLD